MWNHPATQSNISTLRERGHVWWIRRKAGWPAERWEPDDWPEPERIAEAVDELVHQRRDLAGETVLVTAGPTQEPIDPVRYITNRSSGKMGYAIAEAAHAREGRR